MTTLAPKVIPERTAPVVADPAAGAPGPGWIFAYLAVQIACQLSLIVPWLSPTRVVARSASFGISLALLLLVPGRPLTRHALRVFALVILAILTLSAFNPDGSTPLAVFAHWSLYLAVLAPIFWIGRIRCDDKALTRVLIALWAFSTASAVVGVLQAYFPGRFQPTAGLLATELGTKDLGKLTIQLASGARIPRPAGLTDAPGGAAAGGMYAALLGVGIALLRPFPFARVAAGLGAIAGMTCLYLCQMRSVVLMLAVCLLTVIGIFAMAGRTSRSVVVAIGVVAFVLVAFSFSVTLGGEAVVQRLQTLTADNPGNVYYTSRGRMVEGAFMEHLPEYPMGAGLGRWSMIAHYFSDGRRLLWAEVQWPGWIFDGGFLMVLVYPAAVIVATWYSVKCALETKNPTLEVWAAVVTGYNVGALALTFSYAVFMSTAGVEFWVLNAALIQAWVITNARAPLGAPAAVQASR